MATLFDDASLVMIPSGYKDDKLYSIKPVERLGSEEVTNGDFSGGTTSWTASNATLSIDSGALKITSTGGNRPQANQTISGLTIGKRYRLTAVAKRGTTANAVEIEISGIANPTNSNKNFTTEYATLVAEFTATSTSHIIQAKIDDASEPAGTTAFFQSVSMKEIIANGDFTFSRDGSGASPATRVNSAGLIEKGRTNLLLQSNTFDNAVWVDDGGGCTRTSGQSGYDGTNDAWLLTQDGPGFENIVQSVSSSGVNTYSIYAKGTSTAFTLRIANTGDRVLFNLSTGSVASTFGSNLVDYGMTDIGSGWYRCYLTANTTITNLNIYPYFNSTTATSVTIQDAQLEKGLVSTSVIETTTAAASAGILGDMPRLDYSGGATCPSLLLEPARTNAVSQSEYLDTVWSKTSVSVTTNAAVSPEGVQNAAKLVEANASSFHFLLFSATINAEPTTFSFYAKSAERTSVSAFLSQSGNVGAEFDLSAETATASGTGNTASIESVGNGWYRCIVTNDGSADLNNSVRIGIQNGALNSYQGDGTSGVYIWGAQLEINASYPTSYVPTYGSATARGEDVCNGAGDSSLFNDSEGVLFVELEALEEDSTYRFISISDGTTTNRVNIFLNNNDTLRAFVSGVGALTSSVSITQNNKAAIKYKSGDYAFWVNGNEVATNTSTSGTHTGLNELAFDMGTGSNDFYGKVKQVIYFDSALTDAELTALTTL